MTSPTPNPLQFVLQQLELAADQAAHIGGNGTYLAADLRRLVHTFSQNKVSFATASGTAEVPARASDAPVTGDSTWNNFPDIADGLDDRDGDVDFDADEPAGPTEITLFVRRVDGFSLSHADANAAVEFVLPTLNDIVGDLQITNVVEDPEDDVMMVTLTSNDDGEVLSLMGLGNDGFNAAFPLIGVGDITITSKVGSPDDAPTYTADVVDGEHPINGLLDTFEQLHGYRPDAGAQFSVTYTNHDGPLSVAQTHQIIDHPISSGPAGLARFGDSVLIDIVDGPCENSKVAQFMIAGRGEIDPTTLALNATTYHGTVPFEGIGTVTAHGAAELL